MSVHRDNLPRRVQYRATGRAAGERRGVFDAAAHEAPPWAAERLLAAAHEPERGTIAMAATAQCDYGRPDIGQRPARTAARSPRPWRRR